MLLVTDNLRIGVVTGHIPLSEVKNQISKEKIAAKLTLMYKSLKNDFGIQKPKIAVLGLNPHAGENGLLGMEEQEMIVPLIEELKNKGILAYGPFPSDGFFGMHHYKKFDAVLAMYHDQGLIPFKALAFDRGVNFTAGLPFIRTSPDHGTAYDIAGKNIASESSFREALYLAYDLVRAKKPVLA
jgi:4-hydroxythreonine-4-phosphate dehydrogenase